MPFRGRRPAVRLSCVLTAVSPTFADDLRAACPAGVDVYFENVGGALFDAVLPLFNQDARMTICGLIAHYGDEAGADARAALMARGKTIFEERGVTVRDLVDRSTSSPNINPLPRGMATWVASGEEVRYPRDIRQGLESSTRSLLGNAARQQFRQDAGPSRARSHSVG